MAKNGTEIKKLNKIKIILALFSFSACEIIAAKTSSKKSINPMRIKTLFNNAATITNINSPLSSQQP